MTTQWHARGREWSGRRTTRSSWSASTRAVSNPVPTLDNVTSRKQIRVAAIMAVAATLSCGTDSAPKPMVALEPVASTPVPFSTRHHLAIVDENLLCVANSYEVRVRCLRRDGSLVGVFGREGDGPGEFPSYSPQLVRGPTGTLAAVAANRLTVFEPSGVIISETTLPFGYLGLAAPVGATLLGQHFGGGTEVTPVEIDLSSGEVLWERPGLDSEVRTECGGVSLGVASPGGGWTFPACQRELVFFEERDAPTPSIIVAPTYAEEFPNDRDIAEVEFRNSRFAFQLDVEQYKETPKRNHLTIRSLAYDARGRLWVATERDRRHHSYLDIYVGGEHVGTVRVQDRLLEYDLYGSTFVALVEREPDADGIAYRWADWYDISGLDFTTQR